MTDQEFVFALELSTDPRHTPMVADLVAAVLGYVGYDASSVGEVTREVQRELADGVCKGGDRCALRFRAGGGELHLSIEGAARWELTRPLPAGS